ncbi:MAG: AraC family transcriptional regulator [Leptospirales bacterium]|nr:AraC family transcriptional regulator [Leptospirales bacterium]
MDLLSQILQEARWNNHVLVKKTMHGNWGYRFPCKQSGGFHVLTQGNCVLRQDGRDVELTRGDIVFVTRGVDHDLLSDSKQKPVDVSRFLQRVDSGKGAAASLVSVRYEFPDLHVHPFFRELPALLLIRAADIAPHHPLHSALALLSGETEQHAGSGLILQRLTDVLFYYAIRHWLEVNPAKKPGYRSALQDEKMQTSLEMIHTRPEHPWTIESLARAVGISRASLATRFKAVLGVSVMDYVTRVRIDRGREMLALGRSLEEIAQAVGYSSAFAFSKAFKRIHGLSPRASLQLDQQKRTA